MTNSDKNDEENPYNSLYTMEVILLATPILLGLSVLLIGMTDPGDTG